MDGAEKGSRSMDAPLLEVAAQAAAAAAAAVVQRVFDTSEIVKQELTEKTLKEAEQHRQVALTGRPGVPLPAENGAGDKPPPPAAVAVALDEAKASTAEASRLGAASPAASDRTNFTARAVDDILNLVVGGVPSDSQAGSRAGSHAGSHATTQVGDAIDRMVSHAEDPMSPARPASPQGVEAPSSGPAVASPAPVAEVAEPQAKSAADPPPPASPAVPAVPAAETITSPGDTTSVREPESEGPKDTSPPPNESPAAQARPVAIPSQASRKSGKHAVGLERAPSGVYPEPTDEEVLAYGVYLGVDPTGDAAILDTLLGFARQAYLAAVPPEWSEYRDDEGVPFYFCADTGMSTYAHPLVRLPGGRRMRRASSRSISSCMCVGRSGASGRK